MRNIEIMLNDGFIGVKSMTLALSSFATGNLNSKMKQGSSPFTIKDMLPSLHDYIIPPLTEQEKKEQVNQSLLSFMMQAPGAEKMLHGYQPKQ